MLSACNSAPRFSSSQRNPLPTHRSRSLSILTSPTTRNARPTSHADHLVRSSDSRTLYSRPHTVLSIGGHFSQFGRRLYVQVDRCVWMRAQDG
jgi:hypothetical protein